MALGPSDLQNILGEAARQASDASAYSYYKRDNALFPAIREWISLTKSNKRLDTIAMTAGSTTLPAFPTGFLPQLVVDAYLTLAGQLVRPRIDIVRYETVLQRQYDLALSKGATTPPTAPPSGQPTMIGFRDTTNPPIPDYTPDQSYVLNVRWYQKFTAWTRGQAFITAVVAGGSITGFNILTPGSIYASAPTITVADPTGGGLSLGTVTVDDSGAIVTIPVNSGGSSYTSPVVSVNGVSALPGTLPLPDEELELIASLGAVYYLQSSEPNNAATARQKYQLFLQEAARIAAIGNDGTGPQVLTRPEPLNFIGGFNTR